MDRRMNSHRYLHQSLCEARFSQKILNQLIHHEIRDNESNGDFVNARSTVSEGQKQWERGTRLAFGKWALPKLKRELLCGEYHLVRQAVIALSDLLVHPEKLCQAIQLRIPDDLVLFLLSIDPYIRKKTAKIYSTLARQANGRQVILNNPEIIKNLQIGLEDSDPSVRIFIAQTLENLVLDPFTAEFLRDSSSFIDKIVQRFPEENSEILIILLSSLERLLLGCMTGSQNKSDRTMAALVGLLNSRQNDENIVGHALACLVVLCQDTSNIVKAIEMNLFTILKRLLYCDPDDKICGESTSLMAFMTLLISGKQGGIEFIDRLVELAGNSQNEKCRIMSIKALTNIAEMPAAREILLEFHSMFIEDIDTRCNDFIEYHKNKLLAVIRWCP